MDESVLLGIGLTSSEIRVYFSLVSAGPSSSGKIILSSGLQSSVVHRALQSLIGKGLVTFVLIGKNRQYQAGDPHNLVEFLDRKKAELLRIIPALLAKRHEHPRYETEMVLGKKAIFRLLFADIKDARPGEEYFSFSLQDPHRDEEIVRFYQQYNIRRHEKKLVVKVLANCKVKSIYEKNYSKILLQRANVRYTPFDFPQGIIIFRDMVNFLNWSAEPSLVKITNPIMAVQFRAFFNEFYDREKNAY